MLLSPRRRRRLGYVTLAAAIGGGILAVGLVYPNTAADLETPRSNVPATVVAPRKPVRLDTEDRAQLIALGRRFVQAAVLRKNPGDAWAMASPALRQGASRAMWRSGAIPVTPYPVDSARWRLRYAFADEVAFEVWVEAKDPNLIPMVFGLTFVRGDGRGKPWLVEDWAPSPANALAQGPVYRDAMPNPFAPTPRASATASPLLLLLPLLLLVGGVGLVAAMVAREWLAARRVRAHERRRARRLGQGSKSSPW
jgi:hypothetical protein